MINWNYKLIIAFLVFLGVPFYVFAGTETVKSSQSDTIYYLDEYGIRHAFPNRTTYESWFGNDFSEVKQVSDSELKKWPLGQNVTMRSGKFLVKVPSSPEVYAIEPGGVLRHVTSVQTAEHIFGSLWEDKIRDLPEVFFENYTIGAPIDFSHQVPNGWVVDLIGDDSETYFWKINNILEPFESWADVLANNYNRLDVLSSDTDLFKKRKLIVGQNNRVMNLSLTTSELTATCNPESLRAAVVFVTRDESISDKERSVLEATVKALPESWASASEGLSKIEVDQNITIIKDKAGFLVTTNINDKPILDLQEIGLQFYETASDTYDFLIIYNDFLEAEQYKEQASYHLVRNDFTGTNQILLDRNRFYGSTGRLKGIVHMNKIEQFSVDSADGLAKMLNLLHHELLHHWTAFISFDDLGERNWSLLSEDKSHWSRWANWISPMGGWGWQNVQDDLFTANRANLATSDIISFAPIDLYLMGLIPERYMEPIEYLVPEDPTSVSTEVVGSLKSVSVGDLLNAHGPVGCKVRSY